MSRTRHRRIAAVAVLIAACVAVAAVLLGVGRNAYTVRAQFPDAGQLVSGDLVEVGGRKVGEITAINLTHNGLADVEMTLHDHSVDPLHVGTRAAIRTVGLSGVANRFIDLSPGPPTTAAIPDGGVLGPDHTRGVVDLDEVLDGANPKARRDIQAIVREAATALTPRAARQTNAGLEKLNPAVSQVTELSRGLTSDEAALRSLLTHTASVAGVVADHRASLGSGVDSTAAVLSSVASEREALADSLDRAPTTLQMTERTLRRVRTRTLPALDPLVRDSRPALRPLSDLLRRVPPTLRDARPLLSEVRTLLPQSRRAMAPLPALARPAIPAIESTTTALRKSRPLLAGLRPYAPDLVAGFFNGFGGSTSHSYDANGHYARVNFEGGLTSLSGLIGKPDSGNLGGLRVGLDARCPGAAEETVPDGSNPWATGAGSAEGSCDPKDNP